MPIIIDANRACDFTPQASAHAPEIMQRIARKRMTVVVGGRLLSELAATRIRNLLAEWAKAGLLKRYDNDLVEQETVRLSSEPIASDDPHVLALACVSGCRLLYTEDQMLIRDFKNRTWIDPRGKVIKPDTQRRFAIPLFDRLGI